MIFTKTPENENGWESQPIRSVFWGGRKYEVEVNCEYPDGTYGIDFFESGWCTTLRYDPTSDRILIEDNRLRYVTVVQNEFPPQLERRLKQEMRYEIFQWNAYLNAQRKMYRKELKRVYELISASSSIEEVRHLADEGVRLESELSEVS